MRLVNKSEGLDESVLELKKKVLIARKELKYRLVKLERNSEESSLRYSTRLLRRIES